MNLKNKLVGAALMAVVSMVSLYGAGAPAGGGSAGPGDAFSLSAMLDALPAVEVAGSAVTAQRIDPSDVFRAWALQPPLVSTEKPYFRAIGAIKAGEAMRQRVEYIRSQGLLYNREIFKKIFLKPKYLLDGVRGNDFKKVQEFVKVMKLSGMTAQQMSKLFARQDRFSGMTALHFAMRSENILMIELLIKLNPAAMKIFDTRKKLPSDYALESKNSIFLSKVAPHVPIDENLANYYPQIEFSKEEREAFLAHIDIWKFQKYLARCGPEPGLREPRAPRA